MSETIKNLKEKFWDWKDALESKGLKVNNRKTSDIKRDGRRNVQKEDRSMQNLGEESNGLVRVGHKMWKLGS